MNTAEHTLHFTHFSTCLTFASQKAPRYLALTSTPLLKNAGSSAYNKQLGCTFKQTNQILPIKPHRMPSPSGQ